MGSGRVGKAKEGKGVGGPDPGELPQGPGAQKEVGGGTENQAPGAKASGGGPGD